MAEGAFREGTVAWFNERKHYGFLRVDDTGEDVYVHSSHLVDTRVLKKGDRVRFRTVREGDKVSAHSVEKILAQDEPAETTEGQGVSPRSAKESGSWRREKPKLAGKLRQKNALLLQIDTCTVKPYTGDKVSVVLIPEAISFDHAWVPSFATEMGHIVVFLKRRFKTTANKASDIDPLTLDSNEFSMRSFYNGEEIDQCITGQIAGARALWDRRLSGLKSPSKDVLLHLRDGSLIKATRIRAEEARGNQTESPKIAKRHWVRVSCNGFMGEVHPLQIERHSSLVDYFGSENVSALAKVGDTIVVELTSEKALQELEVDLAIGRELDDFDVHGCAMTVKNEVNDVANFTNRVVERVPDSNKWTHSVVRGNSRRDVASYWYSKTGEDFISVREGSNVFWTAEYDEKDREISLLAQSIIVFRGQLTPPAISGFLSSD